MNISNQSGISRLDLDLAGFLFNAKSFLLESNEEHLLGNFTTQQRLADLKSELTDFLKRYANNNAIFYIFFGEAVEHKLKIVLTSVVGDPDERTKRFVIVIKDDLTNFDISQTSISTRILNIG